MAELGPVEILVLATLALRLAHAKSNLHGAQSRADLRERRFRRRRGFLAWRRAAAAKRILDLAAGEKAARRLRKRRFQQWRSNADVVQETRAAACKALAHYLETARRRAFGAWRAAARQLFARRRFRRLGAGLARAARRPLLDAAAAAARGARAKETRDSAAALAFRRDKRKERAAQALQKWRRDVAALRARLSCLVDVARAHGLAS